MPTPGSLFREKRRKLGWDLKDVADELLLSVAQVEAIEQDDFDSLPEAPYIIGYWRSYGNLLGVDVTKEIDVYKKSRHPPLSNIVLKPNHRSVHHLQEKLRKKSAVVFFALSVLFLGVIWYWQTPENVLLTQRLDETSDPQLVVIDSEDNTEQGVAGDSSQLDTQNLSLSVLSEHDFSEESEAGDEQKSDDSTLNLPEDPASPTAQPSPDGSEPVLADHVENIDQGSVNQESVPSRADSAGESTDPGLLSSSQDESSDPVVNPEVMVPGTEEAETVARESDNANPESAEEVAALPEATEESLPSAGAVDETVEAGEPEAAEEDGSRPGEAAALPEAAEELLPSAGGTVGETVEAGESESAEEVAALPEAVEETPPSAGTVGETVEAGEPEAAEEDGSRPGEVAALPEAAEEPLPSAGAVDETVEAGEPETGLESSLGTVMDPTSENQIVVHVEKPMWLDVRERDGTKLVFRDVEPGEPLIINGKAPFWVYLGEADSASVVYLGQSVQFEANEGESFVQIVVGEFPGRNTTEPVAETNE